MDPEVTVAQGTLRGREKNGVASFFGVPYAAPPFGRLRFAPPTAPAAWTGVRDAGEYGPTVPKPGYVPPLDKMLPEPVVEGEDCLNLNVWTPAVNGEAPSIDGAATGLPVLVWIHGGAFVNGSGITSSYDGGAFARDGVVCVTINYRLGVEGFGLIRGAVANRGLLDQIAALGWVRDNIARFGGDPARVTVAGESAGAMSIGALLSMPLAQGLFSRAILQSGAGHHVLTPKTATAVIIEVARRLGVEPTVAGLSAVSATDLVAAQAAVSAQIATNPDPARWGEITVNMMAFEPVIDPDTLPLPPIEAISKGASSDVDILTGTNTDEHALFMVPNGFSSMVSDELLHRICGQFTPDPAALLAPYRLGAPTAAPGELLMAVMTDWFFRIPAVRLAEARSAVGADTFMYEFGWRSPQFDGRLGACHALEIRFTFDNLADTMETPMAGGLPPQELADRMHKAWVDFAAGGSPGWAPYGAERTVMLFDSSDELTADPRAAQRLVWNGSR